MNLSYWEIKSWLSNIDFAVIGSGIVGLSCALQLREQYPHSKIVVFEKGPLPQGASTKNAGFACFGSVSEILDDLTSHTEQEVVSLIQQRIQGLSQLRKQLGDKAIDYEQLGGYELFPTSEEERFALCHDSMPKINAMLSDTTPGAAFALRNNTFGFGGIYESLIFNPHEGQIDTGKMMFALLKKALHKDILILNASTLSSFVENNDQVQLNFGDFQANCSHLLIATNGFTSTLLKEDVIPNRAQVLISAPIPNLTIKGTFHMEQGYYYFRNIDNRILLGGGRHLDFKREQTTVSGLNKKIQKRLEKLLKEIIMPDIEVAIAHRWTGVLGMGKKKTSLIKPISNRVFCGVRLGGMGIAIGSQVGFELAQLTTK